MELMYPIVIILSLIVTFLIFFIKFNKKNKYTDGKKVANTKFIKQTDYFKTKVREYNFLRYAINITSCTCIVLTGLLISRLVTVQTRNDNKYNRDIFLGLDISTSQSEVNLVLIKKFKDIIPDIEGDRIGIVLFNTAPVIFCPLTDDYNYINDCLDDIINQIQICIKNDGYAPVSYEKDGVEAPMIWYGGVSTNSAIRGSSLVGDGLAGTLFSFPDLKENKDRTRIIIFATDNDVAGQEAVSLEDACELCNQYNIFLYAYCPTEEMNLYTSTSKIESYKKAVENNGEGKFYSGDLDKMTSSIVDEIKETKTSLLNKREKAFVTDHPEVIFIAILFVIIIMIFLEKRIRL